MSVESKHWNWAIIHRLPWMRPVATLQVAMANSVAQPESTSISTWMLLPGLLLYGIISSRPQPQKIVVNHVLALRKASNSSWPRSMSKEGPGRINCQLVVGCGWQKLPTIYLKTCKILGKNHSRMNETQVFHCTVSGIVLVLVLLTLKIPQWIHLL